MKKKNGTNDEELNEFVEKECAKKSKHRLCSTLLEAFQDVLDASKGCEFVTSLVRVEAYGEYALDYLNKRMGLSDDQSIMLAIILDEGASGRCGDMSDVTSHLSCSRIEAAQKMSQLEELVDRGILELNGRNSYYVSDEAFEAFQHNEVYEVEKGRCESVGELFEELFYMHLACSDRDFGAVTLARRVDAFFDNNSHLDCVKKIKCLKKELSEGEYRFFIVAAIDCVKDREKGTTVPGRRFVFPSKNMQHTVNRDLHTGASQLIKQNLLECSGSSGLAIRDEYVLTAKAKRIINPDWVDNAAGTVCLKHDDIRALELYYNEAEAKQIAELRSLLDQASFSSIQERLRANGMRGGFNCLFYGAPGTGKTETVYQLARATGRDVFKVDFSQMRDKYIGESEKNVKKMFDSYRILAKGSEIKPILLLNEADALITSRIGTPCHESEKMENTMQDIVLQEMEDLDGILIATTNLADNMDNAFERRFLYKVAFTKPEAPARAKIWKSLMPSLNEKDCNVLANDYPTFAGGQIENISRKALVSELLQGNRPSLEKLKEICDSEMLGDKQHGKRIGF